MKFLKLKEGVLINTRYIRRMEVLPILGFFGKPVVDGKTSRTTMEAKLLMDRATVGTRFDDDTEEFRNISRFMQRYNDEHGDTSTTTTTNDRMSNNGNKQVPTFGTTVVQQSNSVTTPGKSVTMRYTYTQTKK